MVIQEGSCWVRRDDGSRENLTAKSVVIWEPGEWVEYGGEGGEGHRIESYWSQDFSEEEVKASSPRSSAPRQSGNRPPGGLPPVRDRRGR
jgi:hypothetical protein